MLRSPILSLSLFAGWLLLAGSVSPGQVLLAAVLALGLPAIGARFAQPLSQSSSPTTSPRRRTGAWLRLGMRVTVDILRSNLAVARCVLTSDPPRGGFVCVPLAITDPRARALLAGIVTLTPGTLSVDIADDALWVHTLDLPGDPSTIAGEIRTRYESLLQEIYG